MKGDFSRLRFDRARNYTSVLAQQGRVQLDADANEQRAIDEYLRATGLTDIIGRTGAPTHDAGFEITTDGGSIQIGPGRYYVDGLPCEAAQQIDYMQQRWLIDPQPDAATLLSGLRRNPSGAVQVWLEAWQRLVTPIDDPGIKDVALGEADTTDRLQTVWRVVAEAAPAPRPSLTCCEAMRLPRRLAAPGQMKAGTQDASGQGTCLPAPHAAYRGLENQLYRVEVHQGDPITQATFKWSRDNSSVVTRITDVSGPVLTVDSLGPDANLGFAPLQWVEITDDANEFGQRPNQPGQLLQIKSVDPDHLQITLTQPAPAVNTASGHAKLRRWDQAGDEATTNGVKMNPTGPNVLENGIIVRFSPDRSFSSGDYWLIPARTATGLPEWPPSDSDGAEYQPARNTIVHRAPLACIHFDPLAKGFTVESCRDIFSPLTELTPPAIPPALHVNVISWTNDDILTLDQLFFQGLTVTLDAPPAAAIDAASFVVKLEVPIATGAGEASMSLAVGTGTGVVRFEAVLDGGVTVTAASKTVAWALGANVFGYLFQLADGLAALADRGEFIRARVTLKGRTIHGADPGTPVFLDGQCFGTPARRSDGSARTDLTLPSGNSKKASDLESWFYVAPIQRIDSMIISPAAVAFVAVPSPIIRRFSVKLVDNTTPPPPPLVDRPAVVPVLALTLHYNALADTSVALSVSGGSPGVVEVPASVTIPRGANAPASPVQLKVSNTGTTTPQTFTLTATLTLPSGQHTNATATITVTGVALPGPGPGPGPIFSPGPIIASALGEAKPVAPADASTPKPRKRKR